MRLFRHLLLALALTMPAIASADNVIFIARHADKVEGSDPVLNEQGLARAQQLAKMLAKVQLKAIFSTDTKRTQQTAAPLATALSLPVQSYDARKQAEFAAKLKTLQGNALVIGHSNTITDLVKQLGGDPGAENPESEYGRVYQVILHPDGRATTILLTAQP
jgi:broad specificity phosphatase PhoE